MSPQNLTNVYNQNPTLQSSYTLQQYLDLFGGSSTPANTTTTTATTTTPTTTASQGIINQNINQYQNQGGGGGGGLTLNAPRTTNGKTLTAQGDYYTNGTKAPEKGNLNFLDKTVQGIGSAYKSFKESPIGSAIGTAMSFSNPVSAIANVAGMMGRKDVSEIDAAFNKSGDMYTSEGGIGNKDKYGINKVSLRGNYADYVDKTADKTAEAYAAAVEKYKDTKYNYMSQKLKDARVKELKERMEYYAAAEKRKIDAENKARDREQQALNNAYAAQSQAKRDQIDRSTGGQFDGASSKQEYNSNPTGFSGSSRDGGLMGYGGRSGTPRYQQYFNGGIVSLRRR